MSHYTDQNRISDKAWMESVLGQMGLQKSSNKNHYGINEAGEIPPTAGAAPAPAQAPGAAPAQAQAQAPGAAPAQAQQQNTPTNQLLDYLEKNKSNIKHYRKFAKVKARQSAGGEEVQTKLNGRDESEVRTTQPNDWVVSNIESQGENQIVDDKTFRKRYDVANPKGDIYSPKAAEFFGVVYNGEKISFAPPNWGGDIMHIENGYMIGGPNPNEFNKDFYGIDPVAFSKTYKTADQVAESTWMRGVFGESPSKKNYDGIKNFYEYLQLRTNDGINEDDKTLDDFHNPGKMKYIAFVDHLKTMPTDGALILLKDFMIELLTHSRSTISPSKIINVVKFAIKKFEDGENIQVDLRNKTNKAAMEQ